MRVIFTYYKYVRSYKELAEIVFNSANEVLDFRQVDENTMDITYRERASCAKPHKDCNAYIGLFVTSYGQMKLFDTISKEGEGNLLYSDTDSKMVLRPRSMLSQRRDPEVGCVVGDLSDDLKGRHFEKIVVIGKKTYLLVLDDGSQVNKAKGIPRTDETKRRLSVDVCEGMLFGTGPSVVEACDTETFKRDTRNLTIQTVPQRRRVRCTMTSRVIGKNFITYPFGYRNIPFPSVTSPEFAIVQQLIENYTPEILQEEYYEEPLVQDEFLD